MSLITVALLGNGEVGKTSICSRICSNKFDGIWKTTTKRQRYFTRASYQGQDIMIALDDCEPQEVLRTETFREKFWFEDDAPNYNDAEDAFRNRKRGKFNPIRKDMLVKRDAVIIVYACDDPHSFDDAVELMHELFVRCSFHMQGWKRAPVCAILLGNKCDVIGQDYQVKLEDAEKVIKENFTHDVTKDSKTKELLRHCHHMQCSAQMGYGMEDIIPLVVQEVFDRPTKISVNTPDKLDGVWGALLRKYEFVRRTHQMNEKLGKETRRCKRSAYKRLKPIFKFDWLPKCPRIRIPVPQQLKMFPHKMWFCFCLKQDRPYEDTDSDEEALLDDAENPTDDESD